MKISGQLLKAWRQKRTRGDIRSLVEYTQCSKPTIIKALTHGHANEEIILKISEYYSEKPSTQEIHSKALNLVSNGKAAKNN